MKLHLGTQWSWLWNLSRSLLNSKVTRNQEKEKACRPRPRVHAAFLHEQCTNRPFWPLVSKYTIYFFRKKQQLLYINYVPNSLIMSLRVYLQIRGTNSCQWHTQVRRVRESVPNGRYKDRPSLAHHLHLQRFRMAMEVREAGTPHPRKKIKTYLGIMGYLWALEWRKK